MNDGCGKPATGQHRARILETGNRMAQKCWERFRFSHDEKHASAAEWWRDQAEKALEREANGKG